MTVLKNYEVGRGQFGGYFKGQVIPPHAAAAAGGLDELVAKGVLVPTDKEVNVAVAPPRADPDAAPPSVYDERNLLLRQADELKLALAHARGQAAEAARLADGFKLACDEYTREKALILARHRELVAGLEEACEAHQSRIDALEAENARLKADLDEVLKESRPAKGTKVAAEKTAAAKVVA